MSNEATAAIDRQLSEIKRRAIWSLRQRSVAKDTIAEELGISRSFVRSTVDEFESADSKKKKKKSGSTKKN